MDFYVYNTMTNSKEALKPFDVNRVTMYTCGPTVYNYAHIGNLRTYIFEDVLKKALQYNGFNVSHAMNITDVGHLQSDSDEGEDKMLLGAQRENKSPYEIARFYEEAFFEDCRMLNIEKPEIICRATEHIEDMIKLIKKLEEKGYTYIANGNVYFAIDKFEGYNKLAGLPMDQLVAGSRVEVDTNKKNPLDFVLWFTNSKFKNHIMQWNSPWGVGFPGWHVECSAMSIKYLGEWIDIHCGGVDHIPVHHTNEIAQSEAALGHKWVNYWLHGEFLILDGGKMSKSSGDFLTISKLNEEGFSPIDYRYFCLQSKYRKQLIFSFDTLKDAKTSYQKLKGRIFDIKNSTKEEQSMDVEKIKKYRMDFTKHLCDDLNIANAFTVMYDVLKDTNLNKTEKLYLIEDFDKVFSLDLLNEDIITLTVDNDSINKLIIERNDARKNKNWVRADEIRNILLEKNIELVDTKDGTTWKLKG